MMPPMIGLTGYAYVGKDTLAGLLVRSHGYHRLGFADPLKAMLLALDPVMISSLDDEVIESSRWRSCWPGTTDSWDSGQTGPVLRIGAAAPAPADWARRLSGIISVTTPGFELPREPINMNGWTIR